MTRRLLDAELRARSIMWPTDSSRGNTQASNFCRCSRSESASVTDTVSIPNWRKHSVSMLEEAAGRLNRAARALTFRRICAAAGVGERDVPDKFVMSARGMDSLKPHSDGQSGVWLGFEG